MMMPLVNQRVGTWVCPRKQQSRTKQSVVHSSAERGNSASGSQAWTPFDHMTQDECSLDSSTTLRKQRMIETQRGEVEDKVAMETTQDCCEHCHGTGLVLCQFCKGTSRVNFVDSVTVPKGEWPMWCRRCIRCSGKTVCGFCLGSGQKREPIGFRV